MLLYGSTLVLLHSCTAARACYYTAARLHNSIVQGLCYIDTLVIVLIVIVIVAIAIVIIVRDSAAYADTAKQTPFAYYERLGFATQISTRQAGPILD